ncbi:hypothetical protein QF034_007325 [Streptomyces africanus]|uniref:Uncharacterized protein n=1 Tax=Streptomyces africanus TaxID=231024 RepID=A0ABU0R0A5_9ACTN|nr:hypothetical protein [Streptomyces africanus]MDQ0753094.1 hypothetical protein [Streptomyces africanus]
MTAWNGLGRLTDYRGLGRPGHCMSAFREVPADQGLAEPGADRRGVPPEHRADLLGRTIEAALEPSAGPDEGTFRAAAQDVLAALAAAQDTLAEARSRSASR